jgi:hypothetical protein
METPRNTLAPTFRRFVEVRRAEDEGEATLIRKLRGDPRSHDIASAEDLIRWVRFGPRMSLEARQAAPALWLGYGEWRRLFSARSFPTFAAPSASKEAADAENEAAA